MRIGFDAKRIFNNRSGLGQYSRFVVSNLSKYFPHLELVLFAKRSSGLFHPEAGTEFWKLPFPAAYRRSVDMRSQWMRSGIQLYHGLSNELPRRRSAMIKTVVTIHDLLFQDFPEDYPWMDRKIYGAKVENAVRSSDHIIAISEATKTDLITRYHVSEKKISVLYQSCAAHFLEQRKEGEILRIRKKYDLGRPYILCVSSFSYRKNQKTLIHAFHDSGLYKDYNLVLVGADNVQKNILKTEVKALGLANQIKMPLIFDNRELAAIYQGCDLVVYPSIKEGFGIPVVEGMASRKPVITSENTSCAEAGGEAVIGFDALDQQALADEMTRVLNNASLQKEMVAKGLARLEALSPQEEIKKLVDLYKRLTANA